MQGTMEFPKLSKFQPLYQRKNCLEKAVTIPERNMRDRQHIQKAQKRQGNLRAELWES